MRDSASAGYADGIEVVPYATGNDMEVVPGSTTWEYHAPAASQPLGDKHVTPSPPATEKLIFGLRRTTFFLLFALAIAVAMVAIVGGVLGSRLASW